MCPGFCAEVADERIQLWGNEDDALAMCRTENLVARPGAGGSRELADEDIIDGKICEILSLLTWCTSTGQELTPAKCSLGEGLDTWRFEIGPGARAAQPRREVWLVNRWLYEQSKFKLLGVRFDQTDQLAHIKQVAGQAMGVVSRVTRMTGLYVETQVELVRSLGPGQATPCGAGGGYLLQDIQRAYDALARDSVRNASMDTHILRLAYDAGGCQVSDIEAELQPERIASWTQIANSGSGGEVLTPGSVAHSLARQGPGTAAQGHWAIAVCSPDPADPSVGWPREGDRNGESTTSGTARHGGDGPSSRRPTETAMDVGHGLKQQQGGRRQRAGNL